MQQVSAVQVGCHSASLQDLIILMPSFFCTVAMFGTRHISSILFSGIQDGQRGSLMGARGPSLLLFRLCLTYQILIIMDIITLIMNSISNTRHPPIPSNPSEFLLDGGSHADRVGGKWPCRHFWSPPTPSNPLPSPSTPTAPITNFQPLSDLLINSGSLNKPRAFPIKLPLLKFSNTLMRTNCFRMVSEIEF